MYVQEHGAYEELMMASFQECNRLLSRIDNLDCSMSGSTGVVAVLAASRLIVANLGDSRCILGEAQPIREAHEEEETRPRRPPSPPQSPGAAAAAASLPSPIPRTPFRGFGFAGTGVGLVCVTLTRGFRVNDQN